MSFEIAYPSFIKAVYSIPLISFTTMNFLGLTKAIKFNILSLSKFYLFSFGFVCRGKGNLQMIAFDKITVVSRFFCIVQVTLTQVLKTFSIT